MFRIEVPTARLSASVPRLWARLALSGVAILLLMLVMMLLADSLLGQAPEPPVHRLFVAGVTMVAVLATLFPNLVWRTYLHEIGLYEIRISSPAFGRGRDMPLADVDPSCSRTQNALDRVLGRGRFRDSQGRILARYSRWIYRRQDVETFFKAIEAKQSSIGL